MPFLSLAGIEQSIFKYNQGPRFNYSDMNGYGILKPYLAYKIYWILCGLVLLIISFLFWVRGIPNSFRERVSIAKNRFKGFAAISFGIFLIVFLLSEFGSRVIKVQVYTNCFIGVKKC